MKERKMRHIFALLTIFALSSFCLVNPPAAFSGPIYEENYDQILSGFLPHREGVKVGGAILHAALTSGVNFDSNVFLADEGERSDTIALVTPSVGVEVPMQDNRLSVEYEAGFSFFNQLNEQDHLDHRVRALLGINLTDFKILVDDVYRRFTNRAGSTEIGSAGTRTREEQNKADLSIGAEFDKLAYKATYTNKMRRFLDKNRALFGIMNYDDKNSVAQIGNLEVIYAIQPKTSILGDFSAGVVDYDSDLVPNSYLIEFMPGLKSNWTQNLKMDVRIGGRYQNYETSTFMFDGDFFGVVGRGEAEYSLTDDDTFLITAERTIRESIYQNVNYYNVNTAGLAYTHKFSDKLKANWFFDWQMNIYPTETTENGLTARRKDHIYRTGLSFTYEPQNWLAFEIGIEHRVRDSIKFPTLDYTDDVASFQATVGF